MKTDCAFMCAGTPNGAGLAPVEEILSEVRAGRPVVVVDAADRENEGDLIVAAQFANHHIINFMARYARGLICLALTQERAHRLRLPQMRRRKWLPPSHRVRSLD